VESAVAMPENHGIGLTAAVKNTKERGEEMVENFRVLNPSADVEIKVDE